MSRFILFLPYYVIYFYLQAFHVFHISCLVHWILLSELEIHNNQTAGSEVKQRGRKKAGVKRKELAKDGDIKFIGKKIYSVFCPECQGSGIDIHGDELEKPPVSLSEVFKSNFTPVYIHLLL